MRMERVLRRRPDRHSVNIRCQVVRERDFVLVADCAENLSTWGILVTPADPVITGEKVFVSFQIPGSHEWIDTTGVVTRVIHGRRPSETSRKLAIEFDEVSAYSRYKLRQGLAKHPLIPPGARRGRRKGLFDLAALASC